LATAVQSASLLRFNIPAAVFENLEPPLSNVK
jgi:hypothetical protein